MKQIYLFSFLFIFCFSLTGQTLVQSQMSSPGDKFEGVLVPDYGFNPGSAGSNVVWDFSSFTGDAIEFTYEAVNNDPKFVGAEQKLNLTTLGTLYFKPGVNEHYLTGTYSNYMNEEISAPYSDYQTLFKFPFNFNDQFEDEAKSVFDVMYQNTISAKVYRTVKSKTTADATGKVILPGRTYDKVLRIKVVYEVFDTLKAFTIKEPAYSTFEDYYYFAEGVKHQIVYMSKAELHEEPNPREFVFYFKNYTLNTSDLTLAETANLYPNPANNQIHLKNSKGSDLVIFNALGVPVQEERVTSETQIVDISSLPKGIYIYEIRSAGTPKSGRLVVE